MWLFCRRGFFSAVQHERNRNTIHVRARFKGDLERLCATHGLRPRITETPLHDYRYRMNFKRPVWSEIVRREAEDIDYGNFKNAVHDGSIRDDAYLDAWMAMRDAQTRSLEQ